MADQTLSLSRLGQVKGAGDELALFLKVGINEVLDAFETTTVFKDRIYTRSLKGAKSAAFPIAGKKSAGYHTPGNPILGQTNTPSDLNERVIALDALLIADDSIYSLDELMNYWSVRQNYTVELGRALAYDLDKRAARVIFNAASTVTEPLGKAGNAGRIGFKVTLSAGYAAETDPSKKGDELVQAIFKCAAALDKKDVPKSDRTIALGPDDFYAVTQSSKAINVDFNGGGGANGTIAEGRTMRVAGIPIVESNFVTQPAYTNQANFDRNADYQADLSKCIGLVWRRQAAGLLMGIEPTLQVTSGDHNVIYQATTMVAKMNIGMAKLRAEEACAIVIP